MSASTRLGTSVRSSLNNLKSQPWKGPLPPPRCSPKLLIGDVIEKAKVRHFPSMHHILFLTSNTIAARRDLAFRQAMLEKGEKMHARSEIKGANSASQNSNSNQALGQ
jgi:hypothetical protein